MKLDNQLLLYFVVFSCNVFSYNAFSCNVCCGLTVEAQEPTQVVVVSTHHFVTDLPDEFTPGHLRALLEKLEPDVIAVEAPSNVDDPWILAPPEISIVTRSWAETNNVDVVPIGWHEPGYPEQVNEMIREIQAGGKVADYQRIEQRFQKSRNAISPAVAGLNSDGHHQIWREYHRDIHELNEKETPWEEWNQKILKNVVDTCKEHPGKRVVVVIGGAHAYFLLDGLASESNVKLSRVDQFLPLSKEEIKSATKPLDYLRALHPLNLDVLPPPELQRLKPILDQLQDVDELRGDYQLFLGKYLLHTKKPKEALAAFEVLGQLDRDARSKFDERIKLFETGLVYSAIALFQSGDRDTSVERLKNVIRDENLQVETRNWAQQVLKLIGQ